MRLLQLAIAKLRRDGGTQQRADIDQDTVDEYAEARHAGCQFPPVIVFFDGRFYWLADGFHRVLAWLQDGAKMIDCDVRQGTQRDAILYSVGANQKVGLKRSNDDKRRCVNTLLDDPEWGRWSNSEIARRCGVSEGMIRIIKLERTEETAEKQSQTSYNTRSTSHETRSGKSRKSIEELNRRELAAERELACQRAQERLQEARRILEGCHASHGKLAPVVVAVEATAGILGQIAEGGEPPATCPGCGRPLG